MSTVERDDMRDFALSQYSMNDAALARQQPSSVPEGWSASNFVTPVLPTTTFSIRNLDTAEESGPFEPEDFLADANGLLFTHDLTTGRHFVLRVTWQDGIKMKCVNDDGQEQTCLVAPIDDNVLEELEL